MSKEYSFSVMPSVAISRSRFARKSQHKTTFNLGDIVPIYVDEVLPGDTRSIDMAALVRMSTPIAPIMDNIYLDIYAFFVPNRLTWVHWKEFMGENNSGAGIPLTNYTLPAAGSSLTDAAATGSLADYFGLPVGKYGISGQVSALPFRAYGLIYNRWFRNENIIAPLAIDTSDNDNVIVSGGSITNTQFCFTNGYLRKASKLPDYFTSGLPYAQKGQAVSIPLGTTAPVVAKLAIASSIASGTGIQTTTTITTQGGTSTLQAGSTPNNTVIADLSQATAATINQLRYAFQLQKLLEKDALYGTRYWEILAAHFGVTAPDASLQDPEYLGGNRIHINIDQVLSQSGYDDTNAQEVGKTGANSVTGHKGSLFTKSFVEHGTLIIVAVARHDQTYTQGINKMWLRKGRYDFYWPVFANLGAQAILRKEIFFAGSNNATDDNVFAYQESWAEYRYKPSIATGLMRPGANNSLNFWTLANDFPLAPTLGQAFIEQDRANIQRALVTGANGPDFIADFYFQDIAVRPMPMYSIPGLIDHH